MTAPCWPLPPDAADTPAGAWLREHTTPWGETCPCGQCPPPFPVIPAGQIDAEVAADWHRLTHRAAS